MKQNNPQHITYTQAEFTEESPSHLGVLLGVLLMVLVIILGGLYLWGASLSEEHTPAPTPIRVNAEPETTRAVADVELLNTVSTSNSLGALEADLLGTNFDTFDSEMAAIERELDAVLR